MKIINHESCETIIGAPSDMQDGSCEGLPVRYEETEHGTFAVSYWQPEPADMALIMGGGLITLHVRAPGRQHPVVALGVQLDAPAENERTNIQAWSIYFCQQLQHRDTRIAGLETQLSVAINMASATLEKAFMEQSAQRKSLAQRDARIAELEAAIDNLAKCKGRFHTESNFKALIEVRNSRKTMA